MFIGSINRYMRAVLETAAGRWKGLPVYVACSGNFTVERILAKCGVGAIHSNDVSIYSCALGWHLANTAERFVIKAHPYGWLEPYQGPGPVEWYDALVRLAPLAAGLALVAFHMRRIFRST